MFLAHGPADGPAGHAEAALRAALCAAREGGGALPPDSPVTRDAVCGAVVDLWTAGRLLAVRGPESATARHVLPRILLEGTEGLAAVLGTRLHEQGDCAGEFNRHARALAEAARQAGDPRLAARVAEALPGVADGGDRLARPLTGVRPAVLPAVLAPAVTELEAERLALAAACRTLAAGGAVPPLADRYALLTAAAACLDRWRHRRAGHGTLTGDRARLVGALERIAARLGRPADPARAEHDWRPLVLAEALGHRFPATPVLSAMGRRAAS
ncbi:hypothetical protein ACPCTO_00570 [Streptomyces olivoreticuli]